MDARKIRVMKNCGMRVQLFSNETEIGRDQATATKSHWYAAGFKAVFH